jgi:hypothetical protein
MLHCYIQHRELRTVVLMHCYMQQRKLCVQMYWCTIVYSTGNCVYSSTGVLLCTAQVVGSCVYRYNGVLLYNAPGIVCTAILAYYYIQQRELCVHMYW